MRKLTYDLEGNIISIHNETSEKQGILITNQLADKIMNNPLGYKVENEQLVETGYIPINNNMPTQEDYMLDLDYRLSMIELGL